jgi:hypothetical protein
MVKKSRNMDQTCRMKEKIINVSTVNPTRCTNFSNSFYFWNNILHVPDGLPVHHQEIKTVHTASGTGQTKISEVGSANFVILHVYCRVGFIQFSFDVYLLLYAHSLSLMMDGKTVRIL